MGEIDDCDISSDNEQPYGHVALLNEGDLKDYNALKRKFRTEVANSKRGEKVDIFMQRIRQINDFVVRNDSEDWKRSFATGVIFLENSIAINIKQLINLLGKCKSSINGSLHQLGYVARPASKESDEELVLTIPYFSQNRRELKRWTIRQKRSSRRRSQKAIVTKPVELPPPPAHEEPEASGPEAPILQEEPWKQNGIAVPCPAKFRYKFYNLILQSVSANAGIVVP